MGVEEVVTAPRSAWQNPYVERLIGSVRRECLDHSIILNERHLRRILGSYLDYYHGSRTHLSLGKDTPDGRPVQPAGSGTVVSYLRDRLTVARDLLTESGSVFVQIGDENVHRVRALMDEVFGEENFISLISIQTTTGFLTDYLGNMSDFILCPQIGPSRMTFETDS